MADWHRSRELGKGQSQQMMVRKENEVNIWDLITCEVKVHSWKESGAIYSAIICKHPEYNEVAGRRSAQKQALAEQN